MIFKKIWAYFVLVWFENYCWKHLQPIAEYQKHRSGFSGYGCKVCFNKRWDDFNKYLSKADKRKYKALGVLNK